MKRNRLLVFVLLGVAVIAVGSQIPGFSKRNAMPLTPTGDAGQWVKVPVHRGRAVEESNLPAGTSSAFIRQVMFGQFTPYDSTTTYDNDGIGYRYRTGGQFWFDSGISMPSGVLIDSLEVVACDTSTTGSVWAWFAECPTSITPGSCTLYGGRVSDTDGTGTPGCDYFFFDLSSQNITISNLNEYYIRVRLDATDTSTKFRAVNIYYRLQMSPAPGTPTFSDVPTTHPFYQAIEALASAGITSGCAPGKYCPADPITRGQMAAFLARALGLHWSP